MPTEEATLIASLAVKPERKRSGIGSALLQDAVRISREARAKKIILQVAENNLAAKELYSKHGFVAAGKIPNYYGRGRDAIKMELFLF